MTNPPNWPGPAPAPGGWPPQSPPPGPYQQSPLGAPSGWNPTGSGAPAPPRGSRPSNRTPLLLTAAAAAAVLAIVGVVVVVLINSGSEGSGGGQAGEVAQSYLEALARGDAEGALALSATEAPNRDLLTDEVLRQQLDALPISDIEILGEVTDPDESEDRTSVRIAVTLGDKHTESTIRMVRSEGRWKLDSSFVKVTTFATIPGSSRSVLVAFGIPIGETSEFYAFPGALELTTSSPYIAVNDVAPLPFDKMGIGELLEPKFSMTDAGRDALEDVVRARYQPCYDPGPKPEQCALRWVSASEYDPSSITFTSPLDVSKLTYHFEGTGILASISGTLENVAVTARRSDGQTVPLTVKIMLFMTVDISQDPPVVMAASQ